MGCVMCEEFDEEEVVEIYNETSNFMTPCINSRAYILGASTPYLVVSNG